jgi:glycosyltransferase involved in cell wall biosynthesis
VRCLDSVIHQTYQDFEIILIDDDSSDQSLELAQHYLSKFPQVESHIISFETIEDKVPQEMQE